MRRAALSTTIACVFAASAPGQLTVATEGYGNSRTQTNLQERILQPGNVDPATFGKVFTRKVDSSVYARPLIVSGLDIGGARRNVLFVATMANSLYAFDADDPSRNNPLWRKKLGQASIGDSWIGPEEHGVLSTPVIDTESKTLYAVGRFDRGGRIEFAVHALDLLTGEPKFRSPQRIEFPFKDGPVLQQSQGLQRPALLLSSGSLYVAFANVYPPGQDAHEAQDGFIEAFDAKDLSHRLGVFQVTPTGNKGGIWQAGRGLAADDAGNVYVATAAGRYDGSTDFGSSILKLSAGTLQRLDSFTPRNYEELLSGNLDLSAGGVILIPGTSFLIAGGKEGVVYLLDTSRLGGLESATPPIQRFQASSGCGKKDCSQFLGVAFWSHPGSRLGDGTLFVWDKGDKLRAYRFAGERFDATPTTVSTVSPKMTGGPAVSSAEANVETGIVWAVTSDSDDPGAQSPGTLRAFLATDLSKELYNSGINRSRDALGDFTKYAPPVVANGKVYVVSQSGAVSVYGVLPAAKR